MDSEIEKQTGTLSWFWNELEITGETPWNLVVDAKADGVSDFNAIQTALAYSYKSNWVPYSSDKLSIEIVGQLSNRFVLHHSMIPYIGRDLRTEQPVACLAGELENVQNKLAYWKNGAIYAAKNMDTEETVYLFMMPLEEQERLGYPTIEELEKQL